MIDFVTNNWVEIAAIASLVIIVAGKIALLTPTKTDDKVLAVIYKIASVLGLNVKDNPGGR